MFGNILKSIASFFLRIYSSPITAAIGSVVVDALKQIPPEVPGKIYDLVIEASGRDEDNRARFLFVLNRIKADYPDLPENIMRATIENSLLLYKAKS